MTYIYKNREEVDLSRAKFVSDPNLTPYERETHFYISDGEDRAYIDSAQVVWMKYLLNHEYFTADEKGITMIDDERIVGVKGTMPKNCIRASQKPRQRFDKL